MSYPRFHLLLSVSLLSAGVAAGCTKPARNLSGSGGSSSTGNSGSGNGGSGNSTGGGLTAGGNSAGTGSGFTPLGGTGGGSVGAGGANGTTTGTGGASTGAGGTAAKMACGASARDPLSYTAGYTADPTNRSNAMSLASAMSSDDQVQQMSGLPNGGMTPPTNAVNYNVFNQETNTARNIRGFYFRDGPRGVNLNATQDGKSDFSTAFPVAMARGAAFDTDLEFEIGEAIGDEMLASGNTMLLAPTVNILRHPAWGRAQETYGEDVFLLGRLGSAFVTGVQNYVGACAKHYAANNIEDGRETANATMDEQTLREIYGRHYEMIIQEGGVSSIMASYNQVNGTHSTQSSHMLTDLLRTDFGFQGFVLSDWWAMPNGNLASYPDATVLAPTAKQAVNAGLDMELPWRYNYSTLTSLVGNGVTTAQLAASAARILEQKYRFHADKISGYGLRTAFTTYDSTSSIAKNDQTDPAIGLSHIALAELAAEESMVLVKNDKNTLPINRSSVQKIAVIGANLSFMLQETHSQDVCQSGTNQTLSCTMDMSREVRTGDNGSSRVFADPGKSSGPFDGIKNDAKGITVNYYNTAAAAQSAGFDFAVVIAGLTPEDEGEEYTGAGDRTTGGTMSTTHSVNLGLDPKRNTGVQNALISAVAAIGKPMVVVLEGGSVIDMTPWISTVPAVVMAWYPGMAGGTALGKLLFGDVNFSGKLPITWDSTVSNWPAFAGGNGTTAMDYWVGYRYFDHHGETPQYSFGYGMSYTSFTYQNLNVPCSTVPSNGEVDVTVQVINSGTVAGAETLFLFVEYPNTTVANRMGNYKELKGFFRTPVIAPGAGGTVKIPLRVKDLKYWNTSSNQWAFESGPVKVIIAPSGGAVATPCSNGAGLGCSLSDTVTVTQ